MIDCSCVHSEIRTALPHAKAVVHPFVVINSKRYDNRDTFERVYAHHLWEYNVLTSTLEFGHAGRKVGPCSSGGGNQHL